MSKQTEYVVVRDKFILGLIGDIVMYGLMGGLWYLNYKYLGNSWFIGLVVGFLVVASITNIMAGKYKHTFYNYEDAAKYLQDKVEREKS